MCYVVDTSVNSIAILIDQGWKIVVCIIVANLYEILFMICTGCSSGDSSSEQQIFCIWLSFMPNLLWTINKKRAFRPKPVSTSLTAIAVWNLICAYRNKRKFATGQLSIGLDLSVRYATRHSPAKICTWISLLLQEQKSIMNSSLPGLSYSGL